MPRDVETTFYRGLAIWCDSGPAIASKLEQDPTTAASATQMLSPKQVAASLTGAVVVVSFFLIPKVVLGETYVTRFGPSTRNIKAAIVLGTLSLAANCLTSAFFLEPWFRVGNIFLFIAAGALGVRGAVVATAFGVFPESWLTGDSILALRTLILTSLLGHFGERYPRVPLAMVGLPLIALLITPILLALDSYGAYAGNPLSAGKLVSMAFGDTVLLLISGCLLINTTMWNFVTNRPRHVNFPMIFSNALPLLSTAMVMLCLALAAPTHDPFAEASLNANIWGFCTILAICVVVPGLVAWRLTEIVASNVQNMMRTGLLPAASNVTFSGLSSDFWRRHAFQDVSPSRHGLDTAEGDEPKAIKTGLSEPDQGICSLNRNGTVSFANRKFKSFCEIRSNDVIGKRLDALDMNRDLCRHILGVVEETFTTGPRVTELKINQLPDRLRYFEISSLRSESFENSSIAAGPDSVIIKIRDISEKRTIESRLLENQKMASLGSLITGVVQSFNDTLTSIVGQASMARHLEDGGSAQKALDAIVDLAARAGTFMRQLLEFAHGKPGLIQVRDLGAFLRDKLSLLQKLSGGRCEIRMPATGGTVAVAFDESLLMQALSALVMNAAEASSPDGAVIDLTLDEETLEKDVAVLHPGAREGRYARLRIRDSGSGMSPEITARAFEPQFTTKSATGHTGLGLSIVFAVVRAHDGFLTLESAPTKGTTVSLYLPVRELTTQEPAPQQTLANGTAPAGHNESILIVDDNDDLRGLMSKMLSSLGYRVESCGDATSALDHCKTKPADLIILDLILPNMHGTDLASEIRHLAPSAKVLMMSGAATAAESPHKMLQKPFDMNILASAVREELGPAKA